MSIAGEFINICLPEIRKASLCLDLSPLSSCVHTCTQVHTHAWTYTFLLNSFFMCTCFVIWNFTILHIYPLGSPPHSHIVGILLHIIKSEAQRSEEIKLEPRRELHSSKLTVFQVAYLQQKSWEFCFELQLSLEQDDLIGRCYPSLKKYLPALHLHRWQVSALLWPKGEWQLSLSKCSGQKSDLGIWEIGSCFMIITAF